MRVVKILYPCSRLNTAISKGLIKLNDQNKRFVIQTNAMIIKYYNNTNNYPCYVLISFVEYYTINNNKICSYTKILIIFRFTKFTDQ